MIVKRIKPLDIVPKGYRIYRVEPDTAYSRITLFGLHWIFMVAIKIWQWTYHVYPGVMDRKIAEVRREESAYWSDKIVELSEDKIVIKEYYHRPEVP